jgi:hypothetical protein
MSEDISPKPPGQPRYLGDGVYASFDGYQVWLHLTSHDSPRLIALEPSVMNSLLQYAREVFGPADSSAEPAT